MALLQPLWRLQCSRDFLGSPMRAPCRGSLEDHVPQGSRIHVGELSAGSLEAEIDLESEVDLDIQLYDGSSPVVGLPNRFINGLDEVTGEYAGAEIHYSGCSGDKTGDGNEFIEMDGILERDLDIYVYAYEGGVVSLEYESMPPNPSTDGELALVSELPEGQLAESVTVVDGTAWIGADQPLYTLDLAES